MNKTLLCVVLISTLLLVEACFDKGKTYKDGEEWTDGGVTKRCKLYKPGQGIIETLGHADAYGGSGGAAAVGPKQAVIDGKEYANTDGELNPIGK